MVIPGRIPGHLELSHHSPIGVDFHPEFQQIASVDTETGEFQERRLGHREEAEAFYRALLAGQKVRVGMEASGHAR